MISFYRARGLALPTALHTDYLREGSLQPSEGALSRVTDGETEAGCQAGACEEVTAPSSVPSPTEARDAQRIWCVCGVQVCGAWAVWVYVLCACMCGVGVRCAYGVCVCVRACGMGQVCSLWTDNFLLPRSRAPSLMKRALGARSVQPF